jgi:hypothetical protein
MIPQLCLAAAATQPNRADGIPLTYQESLAKLGFPSPLLRATVRGQQAWFIVDTGAGVHTLASWFVTAAGLKPRQTTDTLTGATGAQSHVTIVENTAMRLDGGRKLGIREAYVAEFPSIFAEHRIAGLLSPQLLASPHTAAVLDLRVPILRFDPFDRAVENLKREHPTISNGSAVCKSAEKPSHRQYLASVKANGIDGALLMDTGAAVTMASPDSRIASELMSRVSGTNFTQSLGGAAQTTHTVPDVRLERGSRAVTINLTVGGVAWCGADGRIGMDALRQCVLVLGRTAFAWSCDASAAN